MSSLQELRELIQDKYGIAATELDPDTPMRDKGFDSLAYAEFLFEIEDRFGITMPDPDPSIETLSQLAAVVDKTIAEKAQGTAAPPQHEPTP